MHSYTVINQMIVSECGFTMWLKERSMNLREQVLSFLEKCDELKNCKFIMATTKLKDILKCIVNCPDLYKLFAEVTANFNYPYAKSQCLVTVYEGSNRRNYCVMPKAIDQVLAFTFCLLVEFDRETIDFNEFISRYFPEDGSYFASYHAFCDTVIAGLRNAVYEVYKEELKNLPDFSEAQSANTAKAGLISAINLAIAEEMQFLSTSQTVSEEDKAGGLLILSELFEAVKAFNIQRINALLSGYNYFVLYNRCISDGFAALIAQITDFERII